MRNDDGRFVLVNRTGAGDWGQLWRVCCSNAAGPTAAFPWVGRFAERGLLVPREAPARDTVMFLATDGPRLLRAAARARVTGDYSIRRFLPIS